MSTDASPFALREAHAILSALDEALGRNDSMTAWQIRELVSRGLATVVDELRARERARMSSMVMALSNHVRTKLSDAEANVPKYEPWVGHDWVHQCALRDAQETCAKVFDVLADRVRSGSEWCDFSDKEQR